MKKRKITLAVTATLIMGVMTQPVILQANLKIHKVKGEVMLKSGNKTTQAIKRQNVSLDDVLTIPRSAAVSILDTKSNRVFMSVSQGSMTVNELISKASADASNVTRTTNKVVWESLADNAKTKTKAFSKAGASIHETNAVIHGPADLPAGISYLQYLRALGDKEYTDEYDAILLRRDVNYDDETFNFAVFNTLPTPLYFNIIEQRTDRAPELYFLDNPLAAPRTQTVVEEYLYLLPDYPDGYIVVASDKDFTIEDVEKLLDPTYQPDADFYFTLLRK